MTDLIEILSKLSEQEKEELKQLLLNDGMNGNTDNVIFCPKCKSFHVVKNGKVSGNHRFICKECGCHFTEYKNTIFNKTTRLRAGMIRPKRYTNLSEVMTSL